MYFLVVLFAGVGCQRRMSQLAGSPRMRFMAECLGYTKEIFMVWENTLEFVSLGSRGTRGKRKVPASCIESAEYIIQCYSSGKFIEWAAGESRKPHVYATFGNKRINISETENFHLLANGLTSYDFKGKLPGEGYGLICLNKTPKDLGYNMHLGAVVACDTGTGAVLISNMMEQAHIAVSMKTIEYIEIAKPEDFITANFGGDGLKQYALGLLSI
jgi:hypothetical protein